MNQTQNTTLQLSFDPISFPTVLTDGNNMSTTFNQDGTVIPGYNNIFYQQFGLKGAMGVEVVNRGVATPFAGASASGTTEDGGREVVTRQDGVGGVNVTRKIFVAKDGYFARYLDIFTNPSATDAVTVDLALKTNFRSNVNTTGIHGSSSGIVDEVPQVRNLDNDSWAIGSWGDATSVDIGNAVLVWKGAGGSLAGSAALFTPSTGAGDSPSLNQSYSSVVLQPGQKLALLRFLVQMPSRSSAQASAERLAQLPPEALVGLSAEERGQIVNFAVPADGVGTVAPLPALNGEISVQLKGWDGAVQATNIAGLPLSQFPHVTFVSSIPQYPFPITLTGNSSGMIRIAGVNSATPRVNAAIPVAPFTLQNAFYQPYGFFPAASTAVTSGTFTAGSSAAAAEILFTETGSAAVTVTKTTTRADGSVVTVNPDNVKVWAVAGADPTCPSYNCATSEQFVKGANGSYNFAFMPPGSSPGIFSFLADIPAATGTNPYRSGTAYRVLASSAAITANQTLAIPVNLTLGTISGRVLNSAGNAVSGNRVKLTRLNGVAPNSTYYQEQDTYDATNGGAAGSFAFTDLPDGSYRLEVQQLGTSNWFYYAVNLAAGEAKSADYTYQYTGAVSGTITWADGVPVQGSYFQMEVADPATGLVLFSKNTPVGNPLNYFGNTQSPGYYTLPLSAGSGPLTAGLRLVYPVNGVNRTVWLTKDLSASFTGNGQILTVNHTLPVYYNKIQIKVEDSNHAPLYYSIPLSFLAADGSRYGETTTISDTYTTYGFMSESSALTARVVFNGINFDAPASMSPSDATITPSVVITIPTFTATLQGTVTAGDGITPLPLYFNYTITRGNGGAVPCGQSYYGSRLIDVVTNCTTYDGTFGTKDINGVLRTHPFLPGETLKLTVQGGSLYALGTLSTTFTFPAATTAANITAAMPVFVAKGTVAHADAAPAASATVKMLVTGAGGVSPPFSATTDSQGVFTLLGTTTGTYTLTAQTGNTVTGTLAGCGSATPDPCTIAGFDQAITGLNVTLEPVGTISGTLTQGGTPVSGMTVVLTYPDRGATNLTTTSDAAGGFSFSQVPYGAFTVKAGLLDRSGSVVRSSNVVTGTLDAQHATIGPVELVMTQLPGTISGVIYAPDGLLTDYCNYNVDLTRVSDGTTYWTRTDCSGRYGFANLPADGYLLTYADYAGGEGPYYSGFTSGQLVAGGMLSRDVIIQPAERMSYYSSKHLQGAGDPFIYDISQGGKLQYGGSTDSTLSGPFSDQNLINGSSSSYSGWFVPDGQFVVQPWVSAGVIYNRKLYLPTGGSYLRYLETIENTGTTPLNISPSLTGTMSYLNSGIWDYLNAPVSNAGALAVVQTVGTTGYPLVGMVVGGNGSPAATANATLTTAAAANWTWNNLTVPAGGKACLLHYIFQAVPTDTAAATAKAEALRNLTEPGALDLLTAAERACIVNFVVPAP